MQCTLWNILLGYFIGCMFGVGCAFAVLYTIYLGATAKQSGIPSWRKSRIDS